MIIIHWDFTDNTEVSYAIGVALGDDFTTNCLNFFTTDNKATDVIVINKKGESISRNQLLKNDGDYTDKEIRTTHNIHKMLVAGSFKWKNNNFKN